MPTIMPDGELLRRAVKWIAEEEAQGKDRAKLVEEASVRFNLGPRDEDNLMRFLCEQDKEQGDCSD